jgi:hypothetical protein
MIMMMMNVTTITIDSYYDVSLSVSAHLLFFSAG